MSKSKSKSTLRFQEKLRRIHDISTEIDRLNREKSQLRSEVMRTIKKHHLEEKRFTVGNHIISYNPGNRYESFSQSYVKRRLNEIYSEDKADKIFNSLKQGRRHYNKEYVEVRKK